ncbi:MULTISPECIES: hypothetical protein [Streptomyces]|uniref:hypothetical protein n=1 Tax=Streptomyces TaxID=1883 RepID=UPI00163BCAB5|nr:MULTISPECIES: hypothetical protein [Streptomyces]MBC2877857.1 hypothetical protein [Streptomyces sp. TYQ1024]UBI37994.1 hypothetical protein K7I03_16965 [Streptomyces mobaraensis]UKW30581.1 hypothetical protein MCU78_16920 [Streptomyces sp. TYQ1024]
MTKPAVAWFQSLTESVFALGAAARELRMANDAARVAAWSVDPHRLLPVDGELNVPGAPFFRPHEAAVCELANVYRQLENRTKRMYENTALAYAHGAAAAALAVLRGERPYHAELRREEGQYVLPATGLPNPTGLLGGWNGGPRLVGLRRVLLQRQDEADAARAERHCAADEFTVHLADAAYAFGEQAESALHFALMTTSRDDEETW